jgi:hypothetical protein
VSFGAYLLGVVWLGAILGALGFGAVRVRARLLPELDGPPARLAEITLGLGALVLVPELLGAVGWFRRVPVLVALVAVGVGAGVLAGRHPRVVETVPVVEPDPTPEPESSRLARVVTVGAFVVAGAVLAQWTGHAVSAYTSSSSGIWDGDSLWYHLPFATRFVQSGWVTRPLFTNADTLVTYFPANSEIVLGTVMLPFRRDLVVPLVNLGWLLLAFLAAWSLGLRYRAPAVALAGVAVAMSLPVMAATQAGTARNDAMGVALFLTAAALVAHAGWERNAMAVAGIAAGLALGVKLSTVVPVAVLAVAVVVAAPRARRWAAVVPWAATIVLFGAFWYVRNLVLVGNPIPTVGAKLGPLELPSVYAESIADTAVVDRLRESGAIGRVLRPGLHAGFGDLWWLVLLAVAAVTLTVVVRGPDRVARMLGSVVVVAAVGYVLMPNGSPFGDTDLAAANFMLNLRYALPVLALALVLTAALPRMWDARFALGAVVAFAAVAVGTVSDRRFSDQWEWAVSAGQRSGGVVVVLGAGLIAISGWWAVRRGAGATVVGGAVAVTVGVLVVVGGYLLQRTYLDDRYSEPRAGAHASAAWPWAQDLDPARIAIVGDLFQFPYAGRSLANTVRYAGVRRDDGGFRNVRTCREWREALADGEFRYVVASVDIFASNVREITTIDEWTSSMQGAAVVQRSGPATVYELSSTPDPRACP